MRMPQLMPGTGDAFCRHIHFICASWPIPGRTATCCIERSVSTSTQRAGGHWGQGCHHTNVAGQLGVENWATKRSRSMVRTDQLPWGASGEDREGQSCRPTCPNPGTVALTSCQRGCAACLRVHHKHILRTEGQSPAQHQNNCSVCPQALQSLPADCAGTCPVRADGCRLPSTALAERCSKSQGRHL